MEFQECCETSLSAHVIPYKCLIPPANRLRAVMLIALMHKFICYTRRLKTLLQCSLNAVDAVA